MDGLRIRVRHDFGAAGSTIAAGSAIRAPDNGGLPQRRRARLARRPVPRADVLRRAYYALLSGQLAVEPEYLANGVSRRVRYSQVGLSRLRDRVARGRARVRTARRAGA